MIADLVRASVPPGEVLKVPVDPEHMCEQVGLTLASMPALERMGVRLLFWSFELGSALVKGTRFTRMSPELQQSWLVRLAESQVSLVRLVARLILTVVKPAHFAHRAVQAQVRYPSDRLASVTPANQVTVSREGVFDGLSCDTEVRCQVAVVVSCTAFCAFATEISATAI